MTDKIGGDKIALGNIFSRPEALSIQLLIHELGHALGIKHTDETMCKRISFLMCLNWNEKERENQMVFDEAFVKAISKFYRSRADQAPLK